MTKKAVVSKRLAEEGFGEKNSLVPDVEPELEHEQSKLTMLDCLNGVLSRLCSQVGFKNGDSAWGICSYQANESYAREVVLKAADGEIKKYGSSLSWGNGWSRVDGDQSSAKLEIKNGRVVMHQTHYDSSRKDSGQWTGEEYTDLGSVYEVTQMSFQTTSGWAGECYPERIYLKDEGDKFPREFKEDGWIVVLHRSTGAVTIERDRFPF